jgi:hypothetical protein
MCVCEKAKAIGKLKEGRGIGFDLIDTIESEFAQANASCFYRLPPLCGSGNYAGAGWAGGGNLPPSPRLSQSGSSPSSSSSNSLSLCFSPPLPVCAQIFPEGAVICESVQWMLERLWWIRWKIGFCL